MLEGEELVGHYVRILKSHVSAIVVGDIYEIHEVRHFSTYTYRINDKMGRKWTFIRNEFTLLAEESELGRVIYGV